MEVSDMAKEKVRPRPGALNEALKERGMTQWDAADHEVGTGVDRKTLAKIDRGDEVKRDTLEKVANRLRVSLGHFLGTTEADDGFNAPPAHTVMLRRLNGERLAELLKRGGTVEWRLNVQVVDSKAHMLLHELESAVSTLSQASDTATAMKGPKVIRADRGGPPVFGDNLSDQLQRLKSFDRLGDILKELHECRLAVLGGDFLYWVQPYGSALNTDESGRQFRLLHYRSTRKILLSIEPSSMRSRRVPISPGPQPPKFAPNASTIVKVDGRTLDTADPPISKRTHAKRKK
jgi:transcriptional regulator with XRE-family HTH domain